MNSVVVIGSIAVPGLAVAINDPLNYIRICDILKMLMILKEKKVITLLFIWVKLLILCWYPNLKSSKKSRITPIFLSKGYAEFEDTLAVFSNTTSNARFTDSDFAVSIVVYEEDFEDSHDTIFALPVPNKYFDIYFPNYNNE